MPQYVVSQFVSEDKHRFILAHFLQRRIPDHHPFGSPDTCYIRVDLIAFSLACIRKMRSLGIGTPASRSAFNVNDHLRIFFV